MGVSKDAGEKEIKKAYRKLAKMYHPDTHPGDAAAERRFKEINEAYDVLGDEKKRKLYDRYGTDAFREGFDPEAWERAYGGAGGFGGGWSEGAGARGGSSWQSFHFSGGDTDDLLRDLFGRFGGSGAGGGGRGGFNASGAAGGFGASGAGSGGRGGFDSGFGDGGYGSGFGSGGFAGGFEGNSRRGSDLETDINISFEEAVYGCDRSITLHGPDGKQTTLQAHIPAGIEDGRRVRLRGKGNEGPGGAGDLFLRVHVAPKKDYERKGKDIYVTVDVPFTTAALGGEMPVPTLFGPVICRIPAGTQCGSKIRLRGKGAPGMKKGSERGDEYVVVRIAVPESLSPAQRDALERYRDLTDVPMKNAG